MLELFTTLEFAGWFERLGDTEAEDVATAVEVLAGRELEPGVHPQHGSTMLLWYEDPSIEPAFWRNELRDYLMRAESARAMVRQLESARVAERFAQLSLADSRRALELVDTLRRHATAAGLRLRLGVARTAHVDGELRHAHAELSALLECRDVQQADDALRELHVASGESRLRILFGLDFSRQQGLLVLGERLDRAFYCDSVRRALRRWGQFRSGDRDSLGVAPSRAR